MPYIVGLFIFVLILYGIYKAVTGDRYSEMSDQEFEAEARHTSQLAPAIMGLQKIVDPNHHVEYVEEQQQSIEADAAESGDRPETGPISRDPNYKILQ
ncbi:MAG TPA: hypothetical protein VJS43_16485 [Candidatus Acidoferrales bacterium]|nr:hypothetical protein [Candidatus Acidoferrales bacterium]